MAADKGGISPINIKFKSLSSVFSRIKEEFSSYENSGMLDEGLWYTDVKYILNVLGVSTYKYREDFLEICNYRAELPEDFHLLDYALKVSKTTSETDNDPAHLFTVMNFDKMALDQDVHVYDGCNPCCIPVPNTCVFNAYEKVFVNRNNVNVSYSKPELLRLGNVNTREYCSENMDGNTANYNVNTNTITISGGKIYTNFRTGDIYIAYHAFPLDEDGLPMIPDSPRIQKAIESYIKYNVVRKLVINREADLANILSLYKADYERDLADAKFYEKLPSFNEMVNSIRLNRNRTSIYGK